jgi:hypothetical protein
MELALEIVPLHDIAVLQYPFEALETLLAHCGFALHRHTRPQDIELPADQREAAHLGAEVLISIMPGRRKKVTPGGGHVTKLRERMKTLKHRQTDIYKIAAAGRSLTTALERKASVAAAQKACEDVMAAAEEALRAVELLTRENAGKDTMLRELRRLDAVTRRYTTPPTIKLFGKRDETLSFWGV